MRFDVDNPRCNVTALESAMKRSKAVKIKKKEINKSRMINTQCRKMILLSLGSEENGPLHTVQDTPKCAY